MADRRVKDDIGFISTGLEKVEFVRSQNYLSQLAILIARQEKEIMSLRVKLNDFEIIKKENGHLKHEI